MNEISLQRLHTDSVKVNSSFLLSLETSELAALQARAKARKENKQLDEAVDDLTAALKLNPNNRDIRKMLIKVKEECALKTLPHQKDTTPNNSNANPDELMKLKLSHEMLPIGSTLSKNLKYVDDSASQRSDVSSVPYQSRPDQTSKLKRDFLNL